MTSMKSRSRLAIVVFVTLGTLVSGLWAQEEGPAASQEKGVSLNLPELPRFSVDTTMPKGRGRATEVPAGGDLQQALDDARPGDTIVLEAGATYTGTFTLPRKDGEGWIVVKSSAESLLPSPAARVTPAHAKHMPKLVTHRNVQPALRAEPGAHHYRLIGIELTTAPSVKQVSAIVEVSHRSTRLEDVPSYFVFDRVYIHGNPHLNSQRGLTINTRWTAVIDSWIDDCHIHGFDSQAILSWNGPGPFKIENNFLEGGAENIMFGGAKNTAECMVPSDIEIRRNHFYKDPAWSKLKYPNNWVVKNLFEIKTARRVLLEGNVLENCWAEGQSGFAFVLKSSSPSQGQPWDTTSDVTIRYNRIINSLNGFSIARWSSSGPVTPGATPTSRFLVEHNLFERFGEASQFADSGRGGIMFQVSGADLTLRHNTAWNDVNMISQTNPGSDNLVFIDNLVTPGSYGVHCDGTGPWNRGIGTHIRGTSRFQGNTIIRVGTERAQRTSPAGYPPNNLWLDSFEQAGVDPAEYRLLPGSPARGTATDGSDPGADVDAVMAATAGVRAASP
ncbi:MAG: right-handed parallel beta-helix repeat-containing protein [Planctomycetota bacterium]|jgi:hypothetical protein